MTPPEITPDDILTFWFPDGPDPEPEAHMDHWVWRMRGGAHQAVIDGYSDITRRCARGELDHWAETPQGRLALIIVLDQFSRSVFAGTPEAYAQDPKALALCLAGIENGHFTALENVWFKTMYKLPMEHCECAEHLANLDRVIAIAEALLAETPENLRLYYKSAASMPKKHRAVIAEFGRHPHRNAILRRMSTPDEVEYLAAGVFPHQADLKKMVKGEP